MESMNFELGGEGPEGLLAGESGGSNAFSVSEFVGLVESAIKSSVPSQVWLTGEIRQLSHAQSGHVYLDLVDKGVNEGANLATVKVACWNTNYRKIHAKLTQAGLKLEKGMVVKLFGEVRIWKVGIQVQISMIDIDIEALMGGLALARENLIKQLIVEKVFENNKQLEVPLVPLRIALVASPSTQGYLDFMGQLKASGFNFQVKDYATTVQGEQAPSSIAKAINLANESEADVIVLIRGGGSKGDLATFDHELPVRAVVNSNKPVFSGIGHTGDLSVVDLVSNQCFATPTACGRGVVSLVQEFWDFVQLKFSEVIISSRSVIDSQERFAISRKESISSLGRQIILRLSQWLENYRNTISKGVMHSIEVEKKAILNFKGGVVKAAIREQDRWDYEIISWKKDLSRSLINGVDKLDEEFSNRHKLLSAFNPERQIERGWSLTTRLDGAIVKEISQVEEGSDIITRLKGGNLKSKIERIERKQ